MGPALIADNLSSVNGCSMKTDANLSAVKAIPPERIMFETGQSIPDLGRPVLICYRWQMPPGVR
jgi:hypothetical protein